MNIFTVKNNRDIQFTVRIVRKGDKYGLDNCLTHNEDTPLIEFYDTRYTGEGFTPMGQFVTRYYAGTLADVTYPALALDCSISDWTIDGDALQRVIGAALVLTPTE